MRNQRRNSILLHIAAVVVSILILLPFAWMVEASFAPQRDLVSRPMRWIPSEIDLSRYVEIFQGGEGSVGSTFRAAMLNSTIVAVSVVALAMIVGVLGAYAFARLKFPFRKATLLTFLATYMLPQIALLIPLYFILNSLGLLNTLVGLILVDSSLVIPFTLWILSNYFVTIPDELEEAARIDGTSRVGALFRIILPSAKPGIFAAMMFAFLLAWDEFMYALIFTSSDAAKTLPVAISEFAGRYTTDFGLVAAGGILAAIPPIVIAVIFQRYVVSGMSAGAVKG
ncbi:carbohydrate ABC transporter permease [Paramicrobacterium agarici]|uniref:Carbohydrate ABC transporter membrane protein 2 (CUT1 family) n=1 Tax=Paramicrobacterium agarici TaxID=630514 RepID=A0A2A9DZG7_9MICO|nr:carbohydrate ABC transporter permease [Microbacterium agarici]PFG32088.1 carbohydrate ABC transporter membrane protein 2 (CUT1 family) [Microbacterium agarici]TQO21981.1 carbohydrate ABC transporter membrane protein 2 (CUT1 family) [Microbacterium agarici]